MKRLWDHGRRLAANGVARSAATMSGATLVAQALPLLVTPWLTRLFDPAAFGVYAVWFAVVMAVSIVGSGRYELAAVLPETDEDGARVVVVSLVVLAASVVASAAVGGAWYLLAGRSPVIGLGPLLALAPVSIAAMGVYQSLSYWYTRKEMFGGLSVLRVVQAAGVAGASVAAGYVTHSAAGLALGWTAGQVLCAVVATARVGGDVARGMRGASREDLRGLAATHREFPLVNAPHALLDGLREAGFAALFASAFGVAATGQYSLSSRAARTPASFLGQSIAQVFYRWTSDVRGSGDLLSGRIRKAMRLLVLVGAPVAVLVAVFAPALFAWVFGPQWRSAGTYTAMLSPALLASFVIAPFTYVPAVTGNLRTAFRLTLVDLALRALALAVGWILRDPLLTIGLLSVTWTVMSVVTGAWYLRMAAALGAEGDEAT